MPLQDHIVGLLGAEEGRDEDAERQWLSLVQAWDSTHDASCRDRTSSTRVFLAEPVPNVLDSLVESFDGGSSSNNLMKAATSSKAATSHPIGSGTESRSSGYVTPDVSSSSGSGVDLLLERLRSHLPEPSTMNHLSTLLSSHQSDEDIQSELVEILGFEGDGLSLVEEILRPGVRKRLVAQLAEPSRKTEKVANGLMKERGFIQPGQMTVQMQGRGKRDKKRQVDISDIIGSAEDIERRLQEQLEQPRAMFSEDGPRIVQQEKLPHVYTSTPASNISVSMGGNFALPAGTTREIGDIAEEVVVPPTRPVPPRGSERPVKISDLPPLAKGCFPKYITLNRMQSIVQPTAMNTNENMLVCAPTGAGKTDVALMTILRVLQQNLRSPPARHSSGFAIDLNAFKIIYVAPMKALAAEITRKFAKRLAWLGVKVRELTGDMQLTRQEIAETQIIVTTPEKWDVVTRKPTGEGELASKVKLLIIDEVHLLNEERGAVIETIVARTLRQVESSQSLIRIVGLSATLPNYIDVSDFLRVNRYQGLFFFDASFRPVPLEQHFLGVTGKPRSPQSQRNMDQTVFDKVSELVEHGHQVMVFVHARKETVKAAQTIKEMSRDEGNSTFFESIDHPKHQLYRKEISTSRNKEMKELFDAGFGIHHAGMLRSDRSMMERMFEDGAIKVLCCTSTLAWGVNLPAHAVIIKGTQVYDSQRGTFVDLSVLDVLQIFGRAGRPGYETSGVGYICTTQDKLDHYLRSIMSQMPIESRFINGMVDSLNAEISLGTIANVSEAIQWLGYTYLFVRMKREPFIYGMPHDEAKDDPQLGNRRNELVIQAARKLMEVKMIRFDEASGAFTISDLGRIAAKYYLRHKTVEIFNGLFIPKMRNADLFAMLSQATEFEQIQLRESEMEELTAIMESDHCPLEVKGGTANKHGKVNILLQGYISNVFIEDFALVSDSMYVADNAGRIIRALLEIAFARNWANNVRLLIELSKSVERRMWPFEHPLAQITTLKKDTLYNLRQWADDVEVETLRNMSAKEIGDMIHMNERHGQAVLEAAVAYPTVGATYALRPIAHDLLQVKVTITPDFQWNTRISQHTEPFYFWIQDETDLNILQWRRIDVRPSTSYVDLDFIIAFADEPPNVIKLVYASDRWLGSQGEIVIRLEGLVMPSDAAEAHTAVLDLPFLHISCMDEYNLEHAYRQFMTTLTSIQTQAFWSFYHTNMNVFLSAPVCSGKSFLGEAAVWHAFHQHTDALVLIVLPRADSVREVTSRLRRLCPRSKNIDVVPITKAQAVDDLASAERTIAVATPSALLSATSSVLSTIFARLFLAVLEDLHLLDPMYELLVSKLSSVAKPARTRLIGLSASLSDPTDLAEWLGVNPAFRFTFLPRDRGDPLALHIRQFTIAHSSTLLRAMIKPTYDIIKSSPGSSIVFVPNPSACQTVAVDLVTQSGTEMDLQGFLSASRADVEPFLQRIKQEALLEPLLHGIGYITARMAPSDKEMVLELFASGIVKALIVPREACWTLPVKGSNVIVMGAQYIQYDPISSERRIVNYTPQELVRMQGYAVQSLLPALSNGFSGGAGTSGGRVFVMCQAEQYLTIHRFLSQGLPVESGLPAVLSGEGTSMEEEALRGLLKARPPPLRVSAHLPKRPDLRKRDLMDLLGWTYLARRVRSNPTYYDVLRGEEDAGLSILIDRWFQLESERGKELAATVGSAGEREKKDQGEESERSSSDAQVRADVPGEVSVQDRDHDSSGVGT